MAAEPSYKDSEETSSDHDTFGDTLVGHLSNYEVFAHLIELKNERTSLAGAGCYHDKPNTHMSTLTYETLKYFENTPCVVQSPKVIFDFVRRIKPYGLTKTETLNILNTRPIKEDIIEAIVEESEERLIVNDEVDQVQEIIQIVEDTLPPPPGFEHSLKSVKIKQEVKDSDSESD